MKYDGIIGELRFDLVVADMHGSLEERERDLATISETAERLIRMLIFDRLATPDPALEDFLE